MAWEVYKRERGQQGTTSVTFSITGRIALNRIAAAIFEREKTDRVDLLWDASESKVGIQVSRNKGMYQLRFTEKRNGATISAGTFFNYIQYDWTETRAFQSVWDDKTKMLVLDMPKEHLGGSGTIRREDNRRKVKADGKETAVTDTDKRSA